MRLEIDDVIDVSAGEAIDRLPIIADREKAAPVTATRAFKNRAIAAEVS